VEITSGGEMETMFPEVGREGKIKDLDVLIRNVPFFCRNIETATIKNGE